MTSATIEKPNAVYSRTVGDITALREAGVGACTNDRLLLLTLFDNEPMKMSDAAATIGISRAAMTSMVDRLADLHLIQRGPDEKDRRQTFVGITGKGRKAVWDALEGVR